MSPAPRLVADLLSSRVRRDGAAPLVTYYDLGSGERTELSGTTFANWVAKTANLVVDELLLDPGEEVELALARTHPGHWVTLVWAAACWQTGLVLTPEPGSGARLVVAGPGWADLPAPGGDLVACALHPLGLGFAEPLPAGVMDYALEVRGQPDAFASAAVRPDAPAWRDGQGVRDQAGLLAEGEGSGRRLVVPAEPWPTLRDALLAPLRDGGSSVVVTGPADPARLTRIRADERVTSAP